MKHLKWLLVLVMIVAVAGPAMAGEKMHKKCDMDPADCVAKMYQKLQKKAWLGIEMDMTDDARYKITRVVSDSPAEKAGFEKGDVLLAMNGVDYLPKDKDAISKAWDGTHPGSAAKFVVLRQGAKLKLEAELGKVPPELVAQCRFATCSARGGHRRLSQPCQCHHRCR